jgi:hypothetical protein
MSTNFFFNNFKSSQEQYLLENLIIEAIRIYGENMYYIPRTINNYDKIYGADDQSSYDRAIEIEMYIKSVDGFSGDGNFMSKFGIEIRDQVVFSVAQRVFIQEVGTVTTQLRPNEGDLIYFPLNQKCFQIKSVSKLEMFYQLGGLQTWELTCENFEYSSESFNTGIPEIDSIQNVFDTNLLDWIVMDENEFKLLTEDGDYLSLEDTPVESFSDSIQIENEAVLFVDFTSVDPFSEAL